MSNTAISTQGSTLQVATGSGSALSISSIAEGNPTILTSAAHGLALGDVVTIAGSTAPAGLNATFPVIAKTTNTFAVPLDTTGGAAFAGTTTATPVAWTAIKNFKTVKGFDGKVAKLDATNLSSTAKEYIAGLLDPGQFTFDVDVDMADPGQTALRNFLYSASVVSFKLTLPNGHTATFSAFVESFPWDGGVDKLLTANVNLMITGPVTYA
jgi:hypothetical protein